jgi:hypothetical protein
VTSPHPIVLCSTSCQAHCVCRRVQNNYYSSPGIGFSPFGFSPFGFSPFGYGGGAMVLGPVGGGGFIFQFFLVTALISVVASVVRGFQKRKDDEDDW